MSNVLLWFPRVVIENCVIEGRSHWSIQSTILLALLKMFLINDNHIYSCMNIFLAGFELKKGWHANVDATQIHHDPLFYKDPLEFNPSRFDASFHDLLQ